jgi:hypothetical protein
MFLRNLNTLAKGANRSLFTQTKIRSSVLPACHGMNFSSLFEGPVKTQLNYQKVIPGKAIGRYIDQEDKGDIADVH